MRRIAIINQKGGVGKTTTCVNLGAALARMGKRVVVIDMDPQANLTLHLGQELLSGDPSTSSVLTGATPPTNTPGLSMLPSHIDLSGAELELASAIGRESLLGDALDEWEQSQTAAGDQAPVDYVLVDCPPSLGLLSINGLAACGEVILVLQTEFFALQGLSKLVDVVQLLQRRLCPDLKITGILPCLYDSRLRLAREVLGEIRRYFPEQVFATSIRTNVKLAEAPSHGSTIFEYDPSSTGAKDYLRAAEELSAQEPSSQPLPEAADLERKAADLTRASARNPLPPVEIPRPEPVAVPEPEHLPEPEPGPVPDPGPEQIAEPAPVPVSTPVPVPETPTSAPERSPLNYGATHGEDRPHLAGKSGPAGPHRPWPTA